MTSGRSRPYWHRPLTSSPGHYWLGGSRMPGTGCCKHPGNWTRDRVGGCSLRKRCRAHEQRKDTEREHPSHGGRLSFQFLLQGFVQNSAQYSFLPCTDNEVECVAQTRADCVNSSAFRVHVFACGSSTRRAHSGPFSAVQMGRFGEVTCRQDTCARRPLFHMQLNGVRETRTCRRRTYPSLRNPTCGY